MFVSVRESGLKSVQFASVGVELCADRLKLGANLKGVTQVSQDEVRGLLDSEARFARPFDASYLRRCLPCADSGAFGSVPPPLLGSGRSQCRTCLLDSLRRWTLGKR